MTGQRALVVACCRTPGREIGRRIGQRALGRGLLAHDGAGGWALDRAACPGRGLVAHAGAGGGLPDTAAGPGRGLLAHARAVVGR